MRISILISPIAITISFAIMLAAPEEKKKHGPASPLAGPLGIITATFLFAGFALLGIKTQWTVHEKVNMGSVETIGKQLLTDYSMVFELISIVLLIAIIGSLVIARRGRNN